MCAQHVQEFGAGSDWTGHQDIVGFGPPKARELPQGQISERGLSREGTTPPLGISTAVCEIMPRPQDIPATNVQSPSFCTANPPFFHRVPAGYPQLRRSQNGTAPPRSPLPYREPCMFKIAETEGFEHAIHKMPTQRGSNNNQPSLTYDAYYSAFWAGSRQLSLP